MRRVPTARGFTLIEIILVLAIVSVVTAVTVPSFVRSLRGNRLRAASRSLVMAGRYARSMAVLKQIPMVLALNIDSKAISVHPGPMPVLPVGGTNGISARDIRRPDSMPDASEDGAVAAPASADELVRTLDRVRIAWVEAGGEEEPQAEGVCEIIYSNNGLCRPYRVKIVDDFGASHTVDVDAFSSAQVTTE